MSDVLIVLAKVLPMLVSLNFKLISSSGDNVRLITFGEIWSKKSSTCCLNSGVDA